MQVNVKALSLTAMAAVLALALASPRAARADSLTYQGVIYDIGYFQTASQIGTFNYTIQLTVDAAGWNVNSNAAYLDAVAPGITGAVGVNNNASAPPTLVTAPGGTSDWTTTPGGLNANGCDGSGNFFCSETSDLNTFNLDTSSSATSPFVFQWDIYDANLPTGTDGIHLKTEFVNSSDVKVGGLLSEDCTLTQLTLTQVPEPGTWALMGTGLFALLGFAFYRKRTWLPLDSNLI